MAFKEEVGKEELLKRAVLAAAPYSDQGLVYAGFSLGGGDRADPGPGRREGARAAAPPRHLGHRRERHGGRAPRSAACRGPGPLRVPRLAERLVPPDAADRRGRGDLPLPRGRPPVHRPRPATTTTQAAAEQTWKVALGFLATL